jgi:hypothetical protein
VFSEIYIVGKEGLKGDSFRGFIVKGENFNRRISED